MKSDFFYLSGCKSLFFLLDCFIFDEKILKNDATMNAVKLQREFVEENKFRHDYLRENQSTVRRVPAGYMTGEEFVRQGIENIDKFCKEHGLL